MKINLLGHLLFALVILLNSCNKKSQPQPAPPTSTSTTSTLDGSFESYYYNYVDAFGGIFTDSLNTAEFYANPSNPSSTVYGGSVTVNAGNLEFDASNSIYFQQIAGVNMQTINWNVTGSGSVSALSYSYNPVYPTFDYTSIPDTCIKSAGITFTIQNIQNADQSLFLCSATLMQNNGAIQTTKTVNMATITTNTVNFSPADLAAFNVNQDMYVTIGLTNYKYVTINSKNYYFKSSGYYMIDSYLK